MKIFYLLLPGFLITLGISSFSQSSLSINLRDAFKNGNIKVFNRELTAINDDAHPGINLSRDYGEGVAWLKGIEFSNGVLEFDVRGEDVQQHSFVGIAFHGQSDSVFDAIYLRPFRFKDKDETLRNRDIQYVSLPDFTWQVLRAKSPGKYEHSIEPAPDPNSWVHIKVVVQNSTVSVYINGSEQPSLVVEKVTKTNSGNIGFYVADTSGGDFANFSITKTN